jgi:glyoxylase-like metal-dependent hydrolase (beta-lactamase superfamily II)
MKHIIFFSLILFLVGNAQAQVVESGPYTVYTISEGIYHIEDATTDRPAGIKRLQDGNTSMNNSSDMYLVTGKKRALLIDLSNFLKYDSNAAEKLRSIVYERTGDRELLITITHNHGDHTGMLSAFREEKRAKFWLPAAELKGVNLFPEDRTILFPENSTIELDENTIINTLELPGHTEHGTIFLLKGRDIIFSGDALGSGSGVWLFNYESFIAYDKSIDKLIKYIENPSNIINRQNLVLYGGHYWQKDYYEKLTAEYIYDMRTLIKRIRDGVADAKPANSGRPYLNTDFSFGTATITWNNADAERYSKEH